MRLVPAGKFSMGSEAENDESPVHDVFDMSYDDGFLSVAPVGSYIGGKSVYEIYDMAANVAEWVSSIYKPYPYDPNDGREDTKGNDIRVKRGDLGGVVRLWFALRHDFLAKKLPAMQ